MQADISKKLVRLFPFILFAINFFTKVVYLIAQDISLDEPFTIYHAQFPVNVIIEQLKNYNNPPLYEILLHFWIKVFGLSPFSVRMLPLLFASLSPVAIYYFAKRNFSLYVAITSSLLLTFSNLLMFYAQDCRVYSLFLLLSILSMHTYLNILNSTQKNIIKALLFIIASSLLLYAHYFGVFILLFQSLHLLAFHFKKIKYFFVYYFLVFVIYAPHIYALVTRLGDSVVHGTWIKPPSGIDSLYNMLWIFSNYPFITVSCIIILVAALIKKIVAKASVAEPGLNFLILIWFLVPFFGMFFISFWVPMYISRYLIFALPAYYLVLAISINFLIKNLFFRNFLSGFLVLCFLFTLDYNPGKKQPVSKLLATLKEFKTPETLVFISPGDFLPTFAYTYNKSYFSSISDNLEYHLTDSLLQTNNIFHIQNEEQFIEIIKKPHKEILFFGQGVSRNSIEDPVFKKASKSGSLQWKKQIGPGWYLSCFKSKLSTQ